MVSKVKAGIFELNSSWKLMLGLVIAAHFRHSVCLVIFIVADTVIKKAKKNRQGCALPKRALSVAVMLDID